MVSVRINPNLGNLTQFAGRVHKQALYATALAMNSTMELTKTGVEKEMKDVFRSPTPFTMKAMFIKYASRDNLRGMVMLKDFAGKSTPASEYLKPQITGGLRKLKRFETLMMRVGIMPAGFRAVPGSGAKLDNFGNMSRGQLVQMLSYFKTFPEAGYKANMTDKRKAALAKGSKSALGFKYFVGKPGGGPLGVWQRIQFGSGTALKPVLIFVPSAVYKPIFDFNYVATRTIAKNFDIEFAKAYRKAMATAR